MKKIILSGIVFFLLACQLITTRATSGPRPEEYTVYVDLIQEMYPAELIVILDHTSTGFDNSEQGMQHTLDFIKEAVPDIAQDMLENFAAVNKQEYPLKDSFTGIRCVLISDKKLDEIFSSQGGWDTFYAYYPNSQGQMTLSRVGFNRNMDQALLYVGNQSHGRSGAGYFVVLEKIDGRWNIKNKMMFWIS